jgi:tetratricopeptide (TPR) repeat protein
VDRALKDDPMCAELHFVDAVLRVELGRLEEALASCQRALYLEREQPFFRFYLAWIQQRLGWIDRAEAGFRRTVALCGALSPDASVAHSEGMTAATLEQAARFHLAQLGRPERSAPGGAAPGGRAPEPG